MDDPEFLKALERYYKLKSQYDKYVASKSSSSSSRPTDPAALRKYLKQKKVNFQKQSRRYKCLICSQPGGIIFSDADRTLSARCGNPDHPCNLDIQLFVGQFISYEELMTYWMDEYNESVSAVMELKYDLLFNYVTEPEMKEQLVPVKEELDESKAELDNSLSSFINIVDNKERKELLKMSRAQLEEYILAMKEYRETYKKNPSPQILRDSMDTYKDKIVPLLKTIHSALYTSMDFDFERSQEDKDKFGARLTHTEIVDSPFSLQDLEVNIGDPPAIIANNI